MIPSRGIPGARGLRLTGSRTCRPVTRGGFLGVLKNPLKPKKSYICHYLVSRVPFLSNNHRSF